jgi:hypothetical protein
VYLLHSTFSLNSKIKSPRYMRSHVAGTLHWHARAVDWNRNGREDAESFHLAQPDSLKIRFFVIRSRHLKPSYCNVSSITAAAALA